jgi:hypothetical protein
MNIGQTDKQLKSRNPNVVVPKIKLNNTFTNNRDMKRNVKDNLISSYFLHP